MPYTRARPKSSRSFVSTSCAPWPPAGQWGHVPTSLVFRVPSQCPPLPLVLPSSHHKPTNLVPSGENTSTAGPRVRRGVVQLSHQDIFTTRPSSPPSNTPPRVQ